MPIIYETVSVTIKNPFSILRGLPQTQYLHHVKALYLWTTRSGERAAGKHYLVLQGSLQLSRHKLRGMKNLEKLGLYELTIPRWFQKCIYSLPSLTSLDVLGCFWPAHPLPKPKFRLESLRFISSEGGTLDLELMEVCWDTLSSLQLDNRTVNSLDIARVIQYPPPALTHLKVTVSPNLDDNTLISRLLAACSTLTNLTLADYVHPSSAVTIGPDDLPKLEWFEGPVWYLEPIMRGGLRPIHTYRHLHWCFGALPTEEEFIKGIRLLASSANIIQELEVDILQEDSESFEAEARALCDLVPHLKKWHVNLSDSACVSLLNLVVTLVFTLGLQVWPFSLIPLLLQATNLEYLSIIIYRESDVDIWAYSWEAVHDLNSALIFGWLCIQSCRNLQYLVITPPISSRLVEIVFEKVADQEWVVAAPAGFFPHPHGPYSEYRMVGRVLKPLR